MSSAPGALTAAAVLVVLVEVELEAVVVAMTHRGCRGVNAPSRAAFTTYCH
ncbi:MAG: hypothetical protein VKK94_02285 [Cyanobacteriota bacterium]|nr:hypothetical protein [Cyanobacteriota bacterium]